MTKHCQSRLGEQNSNYNGENSKSVGICSYKNSFGESNSLNLLDRRILGSRLTRTIVRFNRDFYQLDDQGNLVGLRELEELNRHISSVAIDSFLARASTNFPETALD